MSRAWAGACHLGRLADWLAAAKHQGPEVLSGIATQGQFGELPERVERERRPLGFRTDPRNGT